MTYKIIASQHDGPTIFRELSAAAALLRTTELRASGYPFLLIAERGEMGEEALLLAMQEAKIIGGAKDN